jgi:hypothetical protein
MNIERLHLILRLHEPLVSLLHHKLDHPGNHGRASRKGSRRIHGNTIFGRITRHPQIRRPDERSIHDGRHDSNGRSLFFLGLPACAAHPAENQRVDGISANGKDNHGEIAYARVHGDGADDEADNGHGFGGGYVPGAFVEFARGPRDEEGRGAGDEVGWAG